MDEFANQNPLSDWVIQKYVVRNENDRFRLRIGINSIGGHFSSDLRIHSTLVSRHHAEVLVPESGRSSIELRDLNSINGTYINNELYRSFTKKLEDNMIIGFGAQYDEGDIEQIPIYKLIYNPINRARICDSPIAEFIISDEEEDHHIDMKPIIEAQPQARISTVGNILNIFGDADEAILDGLQRINPLICEAIKKTTNAELVILSSDDEEFPKMEKPSETIENCNANKLPEETTSNQNDDSNDPKSDEKSDENDNTKENQLIYSQSLINEMKSKMVDDADDKLDNHSVEGEAPLRSKPRSMSPQIISLIDDDDDDDDEEDINAKNNDFNEDLERKVSNWTNLLFSSQFYPKTNSSQNLLISENSFQNYSNVDEPKITNENKERNLMSENSLIENLLKPLADKLDNEKREKRASTERNPSNDEICSSVFKSKKRRVMRILDESDEESNYSDQYDNDTIDNAQTEKNSTQKSKETFVDKAATEVLQSTIQKITKIIPKTIHRGPPIIVTPPHMKFGRRLSTVPSSKSKANGFLEKNPYRKGVYQKLKEMRKERLKSIIHKTDENNDDEIQSSNSKSISHENMTTTTTTKVKNTIHNRGAFLCEMGSSSTCVNSNSKAVKSLSHNFFTQDPTSLKDCVNEVKKIIRKNAEHARERTQPKKLRFADFEKSFVKHQKIEEKANAINSKLCSTTVAIEEKESTTPAEELDIIIPLPENDPSVYQLEKPKKSVGFIDEPTNYHFESD